ncbi:TPA: hypothetical protein SCV29_001785 [Campylobacter coli]|nr:hypothetical protein [Campylobacter coli]HEG2651973.1 hypothetical protein [Campylobacter coli]
MKHFIFGGLLGLGALAFLAGCGDEAKARVAECKKMEKMNETQQRDCSNAKWAVETEDTGYIEKTWGKSNPDALKWK